jgi:ribonucleotide reductase beta subunit family protein with ferritin-like domain
MADADAISEEEEPILAISKQRRWQLFPIDPTYQWAYDMYLEHKKVYWEVGDVDLSKDMAHWVMLTLPMKKFATCILGFFAIADAIVMENLGTFGNEIQIAEIRMFYGFQNMIEGIHAIMYSMFVDLYFGDERNKIFNSIATIPAVTKKANWVTKWMNPLTHSFPERLIAFMFVEGLFFSGSFAAIYWFDSQGLLPGLAKANEFISRDEALHTRFAALVYNCLKIKLPIKRFKEIMQEAVDIEIEFMNTALEHDMPGMNAKMMTDYILVVANKLQWMVYPDEPPHWPGISNPFHFMDGIGLLGKSNFFEARVSEYIMSPDIMPFSLDVPF